MYFTINGKQRKILDGHAERVNQLLEEREKIAEKLEQLDENSPEFRKKCGAMSQIEKEIRKKSKGSYKKSIF